MSGPEEKLLGGDRFVGREVGGDLEGIWSGLGDGGDLDLWVQDVD